MKGQSLLEGTIAMGIIATALSSALTLVTVSVRSEKDGETAIIATNLAREGVEVARHLRDSNWLANRRWDTGLESASGTDRTGVPVFDPATGVWAFNFSPNSVDEDGAAVYRYVTGVAAPVGLYVQTGAAALNPPPADTVWSRFRRLVTLDAICETIAAPKVRTLRSSGDPCTALETKVGVQVKSRVRWGGGQRVRTVDVDETLFDWR